MSRDVKRPPLRIRPGTSRRLAVFLSIAHGFALIQVWALPFGIELRFVMTVAVCLGLAHGLAGQASHRLPWSLREAVWQPDGGWSLILVSGRELGGRLMPYTYVSPSLVVLAFRSGKWRSLYLVLSPDNLQPDLLRRLRVRLRLTGASGSEHSESAP